MIKQYKMVGCGYDSGAAIKGLNKEKRGLEIKLKKKGLSPDFDNSKVDYSATYNIGEGKACPDACATSFSLTSKVGFEQIEAKAKKMVGSALDNYNSRFVVEQFLEMDEPEQEASSQVPTARSRKRSSSLDSMTL